MARHVGKGANDQLGGFSSRAPAAAPPAGTGIAFMNVLRFLQTFVLALGVAIAFTAGAQERQPEYTIAPGDSIRITVFQNADLTLDTRVTENGFISFPLIGAVRIGGMRVAAAEQAIAKALRDGGFVRDPQVNIGLLQMRGNQISVLGLVSKPGRYALETVNIRVSEVLALAGGIVSGTNGGADTIILTGVRDGKQFRREIDIAAIFLDNRLADDAVVAGGDVIYVHRAPVFYIYGEVQKAGSYRIERAMTVRQALAQAGGPTTRGTERLRLHRRSAAGTVEQTNPDLNALVESDDVYYVRESLF
jgi:polysaccharide biosynthesis/export protein